MNSKLNPASETISMVKAAQTNEEDIPVAPLPNPGEGGPVYDDSMDNNSGGNGSFGDDLSSIPVIPLPNPGEGGPYTMDLITTVHLVVCGSRGILMFLYTVLFSRLTALLPFFQASAFHVITAPLPPAWGGYAF